MNEIGNYRDLITVYEAKQNNSQIIREKKFDICGCVEQTKSRGIWSAYATTSEQFRIKTRLDDITLFDTLKWGDIDLWVHSIFEKELGFLEILACRADISNFTLENNRFFGSLAEKYVKYEEPIEPYSEVQQAMVLVVPKLVSLRAGELVKDDMNRCFVVHCPHELDTYKNEYEVFRRYDV